MMSNKEIQKMYKDLLAKGYTEEQLVNLWYMYYCEGKIDFYELEKYIKPLNYYINPKLRIKMINNQKSLVLTKAEYKKISSYYRNMFLESCKSFLRIFELFTPQEKEIFKYLHGNFKNKRTFALYEDAAQVFKNPETGEQALYEFEEKLIDKLKKDKRTGIICKESNFHGMLQSLIYLYGINHVCMPYKTYLAIIQDQELASSSFALYRYYIMRISDSSIQCGKGLYHYDSCLYDCNYINQEEADNLMKEEIEKHTSKEKERRTKFLMDAYIKTIKGENNNESE